MTILENCLIKNCQSNFDPFFYSSTAQPSSDYDIKLISLVS